MHTSSTFVHRGLCHPSEPQRLMGEGTLSFSCGSQGMVLDMAASCHQLTFTRDFTLRPSSAPCTLAASHYSRCPGVLSESGTSAFSYTACLANGGSCFPAVSEHLSVLACLYVHSLLSWTCSKPSWSFPASLEDPPCTSSPVIALKSDREKRGRKEGDFCASMAIVALGSGLAGS